MKSESEFLEICKIRMVFATHSHNEMMKWLSSRVNRKLLTDLMYLFLLLHHYVELLKSTPPSIQKLNKYIHNTGTDKTSIKYDACDAKVLEDFVWKKKIPAYYWALRESNTACQK